MLRALKHLIVFILWNLAAGGVLLFLPSFVGIPAALALTGLFLWGYLVRSPTGEHALRNWATLRLRPIPAAALPWVIGAIPVLLLLTWSMGDVYTRLVPVPPASLNPFEPILATPGGLLAICILAIAVAPLIEEFLFRGLIQRDMERRYGTFLGILFASVLFALIHFLPWVLPLHVFLGATFGFAVWATGSIWTGVLLHAANNTAAMVLLGFQGAPEEVSPTLWETGLTTDLWTAIAILVASGAAAVFIGAKLLATGRVRPRLPSA